MYELVYALCNEDLLHVLAQTISQLPFEARKDTQVIFSNALRYKPPNTPDQEPPALTYIIHNRPDIVTELCFGYDKKESAAPCGGVLREALKFDVIAALILYDEPGSPRSLDGIDPGEKSTGDGVFWRFFNWIDKSAFEISADAFNTFKVGRACGIGIGFTLAPALGLAMPLPWSHFLFLLFLHLPIPSFISPFPNPHLFASHPCTRYFLTR